MDQGDKIIFKFNVVIGGFTLPGWFPFPDADCTKIEVVFRQAADLIVFCFQMHKNRSCVTD